MDGMHARFTKVGKTTTLESATAKEMDRLRERFAPLLRLPGGDSPMAGSLTQGGSLASFCTLRVTERSLISLQERAV
jgi:hypothetical protein